MPIDDTDALLRQMRELVQAGGSGRSRLSAWMAEHQEQIAGMIEVYGAAWDSWAVSFINAGLMPPPKGWGVDGSDGARARRRAAGAARMAWQRLCQRRAGRTRALARQDKPQVPQTHDDKPAVPTFGENAAATRRLLALDRELRERSR
jgi:hypothetical protein